MLGWALRRFAHGQNVIDKDKAFREATDREIEKRISSGQQASLTEENRQLLRGRIEQAYTTLNSHISGNVPDEVTLHSGGRRY